MATTDWSQEAGMVGGVDIENITTLVEQAETAETNAAASAAAAIAAREAIDGLYLGAQASNPTVDLNGDPLTAGAWYFNTTDNNSRVWDGSAWNIIDQGVSSDANPTLGADLNGAGYNISNVNDLTIAGDLTVDTDTLYVDSTSDRVGIGTSNPTEALDVVGSARVFGPSLSIGSDATSNVNLNVGSSSTGSSFVNIQGNSNTLTVSSDGTFTNTSNIPVEGELVFSTDDGTGPSPVVFFKGDGKVGIGKTNPQALLDVTGGSVANAFAADVDGPVTTVSLGTQLDQTGFRYNIEHDRSTGVVTHSVGSNASVDAITIASSGIVGVGTTIETTSRLQAEASSAYDSAITVRSDDSELNWARLDFDNQNLANPSLINLTQNGEFTFRHGETTGQFYFRDSDGTAQLNIDSSGNVGLDVGNGDGYGITFNSTTHNAATTLDYYEEGSWTPVIADAATGGNVASVELSEGLYTRIGRMVYCSIVISGIDTTGLNSGNLLHLRSLPFTVSSGIQPTHAAVGSVSNINSAGTDVRQNFCLQFNANSTFCYLVASGDNQTIDYISISEVTSGDNAIRASVFYFAQ